MTNSIYIGDWKRASQGKRHLSWFLNNKVKQRQECRRRQAGVREHRAIPGDGLQLADVRAEANTSSPLSTAGFAGSSQDKMQTVTPKGELKFTQFHQDNTWVSARIRWLPRAPYWKGLNRKAESGFSGKEIMIHQQHLSWRVKSAVQLPATC